MAISKDKPNVPQTVVDAVREQQITDNRVTGFDVTVERVIGHVSYANRGKPVMVAVMEMIGGVLDEMEMIGGVLDENPVADMPVNFRFECLGERFRVTVDVEDSA